MKRFILLSCLLLSAISFSQYTEIANINFQKHYGETQNGQAYNTNVLDASLLVGFPLKKNSEKNILFFRPSYQQRILEGASELRLYKPELIAGLSHKINETWQYRIFGLTRLASDFEKINSDHYQFGGGAIATYSKNENLSLKFGGYARNQPDGILAFPFLGLDYNFGNKKWFLNVLLPQYAYLRYTLAKDKWYTGARFTFVTEQYQISEEFSPINYLELTEFKSELYIEYYVSKNLVSFFRAGLLNYQEYEAFDTSEVLLNNTFNEVENLSTFTFGLSYRLKN